MFVFSNYKIDNKGFLHYFNAQLPTHIVLYLVIHDLKIIINKITSMFGNIGRLIVKYSSEGGSGKISV